MLEAVLNDLHSIHPGQRLWYMALRTELRSRFAHAVSPAVLIALGLKYCARMIMYLMFVYSKLRYCTHVDYFLNA